MNTKNFDHTIAEYRALQYWSDGGYYLKNGKLVVRWDDPLTSYLDCIGQLLKSGVKKKHVQTLKDLLKDLKELRLEFMKVNLGDDMPEALAAELKEMKRPMFNTLEEWLEADKKWTEAIRQKGGAA